jgi:hypothetical protein
VTPGRQPPAPSDRTCDGKLPELPSPSVTNPNRLDPLAEKISRVLATLAAFMEIAAKSLNGIQFQKELDDCRRAGIVTESDLWHWARDRFGARRVRTSTIEMAERRADSWLNRGGWLASWTVEGRPEELSPSCPSFLFGMGECARTPPLFAWFNSRKPRRVDVAAPWLEALRMTLQEAQSQSGCFLGSSGTLTYELVSAFAVENSSPLVQITPEAIVQAPHASRGRCSPPSQLSCQLINSRCPEAVRWTCRDRLLAFLADVHIALQLRPSGGLIQTLTAQHDKDPRTLWVFQGGAKDDSSSAGNRELLRRFQTHARIFSIPATHKGSCLTHGLEGSRVALLSPSFILWRDYLFHYTRPCPGPWPGDSPRDYHRSLLLKDPLASHSALDTLIRILLEGRIRASSRMVRGQTPVVSLSSRGPRELDLFRQWNRSQARWTLEPYGVAVKRKKLKGLGAKPTIYGAESTFPRLRPEDRFRFQVGDSSKRWMAEREWRLKGDLWIDRLEHEDLFFFVPHADDADRLQSIIGHPIRIATSGD